MKTILKITFIITIFVVMWFPFSSCEKETEIIYRDSIVYVKSIDSVKVNFVMTLTYSSGTYVTALLRGSDASLNVPKNAEYTWKFDSNFIGQGTTVENLYNDQLNGNHILSLSIYCPDQKKTYTAAKAVTIDIK